MLLRVYLNDWFFNSGICGFVKILQYNNIKFEIYETYVEFDSKILNDFPEYYFKYFLDKYDVYNITKIRLYNMLDKIREKNVISKKEIKFLKEDLIKTLNKVKKVDSDIHDKMYKIKEDIVNIHVDYITLKSKIDSFLMYLNIDYIKEKITINLIKSIFSNNFFGQTSFLNVAFNKASTKQQKDIMYKDYISNIVESSFLYDYINNLYSYDELKINIDDRLKDNKLGDIRKYYEFIKKKYIDKSKTEDALKTYITNNVLSKCTLCLNESCIVENYTEGSFIPLAVSIDNSLNFFYNENNNLPVCSLCKLILFCIPAGVSSISKITKEYSKISEYNQNTIYRFANFDTDINTLININNEKLLKNKYTEVILELINTKDDISIWDLSSMFIVEFDASYSSRYSRINSFNISRYVAIFLKTYSKNLMKSIINKKIKLQVLDNILKNIDLDKIGINNIRNVILSKTSYSAYDSLVISKIKLYLSLLKQEESKMLLIDCEERLDTIYEIGVMLNKELMKKGEQAKLNEYAYRLLNCIKSKDSKGFIEIVIRLHIFLKKDISKIFLEIVKEKNLDIFIVGQAFISGFMYDGKEVI